MRRIPTQEKSDTMNNEVIIICESIYRGNTMRLAKSMAERMKCKLISVQQAATEDLKQYRVIGLGSGIYFTSHHPKIIEFVQKMNPEQKAFIFSSRGGPFLGSYHEKLKQELARRNIQMIGEFSSKGFDCTGPFIIVGGVNQGRPNERDERRASKFISEIFPQYCIDKKLVRKGHFIYIDDSCTHCERCMNICPMRVFHKVEGNVVPRDEESCIHCSLCQQECPTNAISVHHGFIDALRIAARHAKRKSL